MAKRQASPNPTPSTGAKQARVQEPFREPDELCDVVLVVEGSRLHAHRSVLGLYSPVFKAMFLSDFKERDAKEIPLPDNKLASVLAFLKLMYPLHSLQPVTDDVLVDTMALADEYQVEHIQRRFEQHIGSQITSQGDALSADQTLTCLCMCETYRFSAHRHRLVELAAQRSTQDLQNSAMFPSLPPSAAKDVAVKRCQLLEARCATLEAEKQRLTHTERDYESLVQAVRRLKDSASSFQSLGPLAESCARDGRHNSRECSKPYNDKHYCKNCIVSKLSSAIIGPLQLLPTGNYLNIVF